MIPDYDSIDIGTVNIMDGWPWHHALPLATGTQAERHAMPPTAPAWMQVARETIY